MAKIDVDRNGKVSRCTVDMQFIPGNVPVSVTDREMRVERRTVHRIVLRDLRTVYRNKTWKSAVLARLVTVLDDAKNEFGILEGRDWMTDALVWLNYVNLDGEDVEMEGSSEEEIEDAEDEVSMDKGGDQEVEDIGEIVAGGYGHDEDMTEEGSVESEGSDMSVDDVQDL